MNHKEINNNDNNKTIVIRLKKKYNCNLICIRALGTCDKNNNPFILSVRPYPSVKPSSPLSSSCSSTIAVPVSLLADFCHC